jgi:two-component system KDP operon response regulator KdpE
MAEEKGRILLVDDEPQICRVLCTVLAQQGFDVWCAGNGQRALDLVRSHNFDLILLDLNLPDTTGTELCRTIRTSFDTAIVILTVRGAEGDKIAAFDAGADDYVTKPFATSILLARIRANLRRPNAEEALDLFTCPDLEINFSARTVTRQGQQARLPRKQYQLLRYLVCHQGESLSQRALLQAIWGSEHGEESGLLQVAISQLRQKIEPNPKLPRYIVTIPWFGYRFEPH